MVSTFAYFRASGSVLCSFVVSLSPDYFERLRTQISSYFYFCGKVRLLSTLRFVFAIYGLQFRVILIWGWCEAFFLGDEYIVYYIQGVDIPHYGCARGYNYLFTCYYYMGNSSNVKFSIWKIWFMWITYI